MMRSILLATFLISVLLLSACRGGSGAPSILEDSTFEPLSWNGILIGETSFEETIQILEALPAVRDGSVAEVGVPHYIFENGVNFSLGTKNRPSISGFTNFLDGKIVYIAFCGDLDITFGEVIELAGEPEFIVTEHGGEMGGYFVTAISPSLGVDYSIHTALALSSSEPSVLPNSEIWCISYFQPELYELLLNTPYFWGGENNPGRTAELIHTWDGYGNIEDKYPLIELDP
jgi:hypothetical protein